MIEVKSTCRKPCEFDVTSFLLGFQKGKASASASAAMSELNIAYGDTPPEDTSKLWVKASEPSRVLVSNTEGVFHERCVCLEDIRPEGFDMSTAAKVGTKIYCFGGYSTKQTDKIFCFDTEKNTFVELTAKLPAAQVYQRCGAFGTKIYIIAGVSGNSACNEVYCFDTETETLTTVSTESGHLYRCAVGVIGTKLYALGGYASGTISKAIQCFDTETLVWTTLSTTMPVAIAVFGYAERNNKIFTFGGTLSSGQSKAIYCFDGVSQSVSTKNAVLPNQSNYWRACCIGDYIYAFYLTEVYRYDPQTDKIEIRTVKTPKSLTSAYAFVGDENGAYILDNSRENKNVYRLDMASNALVRGTLHIAPNQNKNHFNIINGAAKIQVGVEHIHIGNAEGIGESVEAALYKNGEWQTI